MYLCGGGGAPFTFGQTGVEDSTFSRCLFYFLKSLAKNCPDRVPFNFGKAGVEDLLFWGECLIKIYIKNRNKDINSIYKEVQRGSLWLASGERGGL
jgi:hypothetical protein